MNPLMKYMLFMLFINIFLIMVTIYALIFEETFL